MSQLCCLGLTPDDAARLEQQYVAYASAGQDVPYGIWKPLNDYLRSQGLPLVAPGLALGEEKGSIPGFIPRSQPDRVTGPQVPKLPAWADPSLAPPPGVTFNPAGGPGNDPYWKWLGQVTADPRFYGNNPPTAGGSPKGVKGPMSYPLQRNLNPYGSQISVRTLSSYGGQYEPIRALYSFPLQRNLDPYGSYGGQYEPIRSVRSYPLTGHLDPLGDWSNLLGGLATTAINYETGGAAGGAGNLFNRGGSKTSTNVTITPPAQPAPPVPFNWTPVIVSGGVVLVALTLIMTTTKGRR